MNNMSNNCMSCRNNQNNMRDDDIFNSNVPLGMAYIPWQTWGDVYDLNRGVHAGTIFPCLDKPFVGKGMWK